MAAIAGGSAEAFATLFRRRQGEVYRFAVHMTGSQAMADDVTQDVFLVVMRDAARYEPGRSTVAAWLCGIARNCARQRLQREHRLDQLQVEDGDGQRAPAVEPDPVSDMVMTERVDRLRRAVLALPLRYREVVVLCNLQELSYAEAADALACAIGTVRSRLHRARSLLAAKMAAAEKAIAPPGTAAVAEQSAGAGSPAIRPSSRRCLA